MEFSKLDASIIIIRPYVQSSDASVVRKIWSDGLLGNITDFGYPQPLSQEESDFVRATLEAGDMRDLEQAYQTNLRTNFWVAEDTSSGSIVGCVGIRSTNDPTVADIGRMTVSPLCRGRGVCRMLMSALERHAVDTGFHCVTATTVSLNTPALEAYAALGYEEVFRGRQDGKINEPAFVKLRKQLL